MPLQSCPIGNWQLAPVLVYTAIQDTLQTFSPLSIALAIIRAYSMPTAEEWWSYPEKATARICRIEMPADTYMAQVNPWASFLKLNIPSHERMQWVIYRFRPFQVPFRAVPLTDAYQTLSICHCPTFSVYPSTKSYKNTLPPAFQWIAIYTIPSYQRRSSVKSILLGFLSRETLL